MATLSGKLGKFDLLRVAWRLLWIQGLLNQRGMQNLGLANAIVPASAKYGGDDNSLLRRQMSYFNSNPNLVPLIVGGVLRLEEERQEGRPITTDDIEHFKASTAGPLAAMGDLLFLGGLKPLALTFGCIFAIYKLPIGLLAIFLLYNLTIISCRLWGVYFGYAKGWGLVEALSGPEFQRALGIVQGIGAGAGGALVGIVYNRLPQSGQWLLPLGLALTGFTLYLLKKNIPTSWFAMILFPASMITALLFG
jgi:PTS system mannose-specific IID component